MSLGYLGYAKLADVFLLTESCDIARQIAPLESTAVWGAGWYTGATTTNYADNQQHFEGALSFEIQGIPSVWNLIRDWLIEQRVYPKSFIYSPNGINVYDCTVEEDDCRSGAWLKSASFDISAQALVKANTNVVALKRNETLASTTYRDIRVGPGLPTGPLNPSPRNRNPIPGWTCKANISWPNSPDLWSPTNCQGLVMMTSNISFDNNTQIIYGCTGDNLPVAVLQGTMTVSGSINLWRDGSIPDPYEPPGNFTAADSYINLEIGDPTYVTLDVPHTLLKTDSFPIVGQNTPVSRNFGFSGLGDGTAPPMIMSVAS